MTKFFAGVVVGIIISTIGFAGLVRVIDNGVNKVKDIAAEQAK